METDVWLTPPYILEALGEFDLDPCSPIDRPWDTAKKHLTKIDNGLMHDWEGRVWCNPPYGKHTRAFPEKCFLHGDAIALIFARTETTTFFDCVWLSADAILFLKGRIFFHHADGQRAKHNGGAPSCLIAYGEDNAECLENCGLEGKVVRL